MEQKKKIMFCIPSLGSGGAERVVSVLSNKFTERGYSVTVLMLSHLKCQYPLDKRVTVKCINCDDDMGLSFAKRFLLRIKKIRNAVKEIMPDFVISFMSETNIDVCFALRGMKIPVIVSERNDPAIDPSSRIKQIMRRFAYRKPDGFVFQTPDAQAYFSKRIRNKSCIILNPLNSQLPSPCAAFEKDKRVVAVGRLNKQKNFPLLIDAFSTFWKLHPEYTLEIYGEGALENELKEYTKSKELGDKVAFKGFCKDVHEQIKTAAMFVMSSDFEGMPNALLEAMAIGLTCISTDCPCGGPRMLIEQKENGILVPIKDCKALSEAMDYVASNPNEAEKIAKNAVSVRERADVESVIDSWIDFINKTGEI